MSLPDYEDGGVTLYCGDCLRILPSLTGIDAVVTDPPYGLSRSNHGNFGESRGMILGDDSQDVGQAVLDWSQRQALPTAVFASPRLPWPGKWRNLIVWDKGGAVGSGGDMTTCLKLTWELIQVARNGRVSHRDVSVWRHVVTPRSFGHHPNEKPVHLMQRIIETFRMGPTILDPFMGAGSTGIACVHAGVAFVGIESDPAYFAIARERIRAAIVARAAAA